LKACPCIAKSVKVDHFDPLFLARYFGALDELEFEFSQYNPKVKNNQTRIASQKAHKVQ
jgi:hypothetical protein